jgi:NAD(P)-dependent dehydrogenase (short-subunit alcohol dehydrogenase family)
VNNFLLYKTKVGGYYYINTILTTMPAPAKSVLITGAAQGLGQAVALRLAEDGFKVALNDVNPEGLQKTQELLAAKGYHAIVVPGDVSVDEDVERAVTQTVAEFGYLDVVCASHAICRSPFIHNILNDLR